MAGEYDPTNFTIPQQPLHKCMFAQASRFPTFKTVTNPYDCHVEGVRWVVRIVTNPYNCHVEEIS